MVREIAVAFGFIIAAVVIVFLVAGTPMWCQAPIGRPPFRGCRRRVPGFFGRCRDHGVRPGRRLVAVLGGQQLPLRRICAGCGRPAVFCRARDTGRPFLGCSGFPDCKKRRWLAGG
jgi:hypothetical protein